MQLREEEIALLEGPGAFVSAAAESSWPRPLLADEPVTLVAVRRQWPSAPARDDPRSVLASWREDTGQPTIRAAATLDDHGFSRSAGVEPRSSESYFLLPHAEAVLVRARPTRAAEAADLLGQDFVVTPDVLLAAPPPPPEATSRIVRQPELNEQTEYRWPERSGVQAAHEAGIFGEGVVIGVFDTGCDADHAEFIEQTVDFVYVPPGGGLQRSVRGFATDWHGTHVAAIAAGRRRGIAPEATLLAAGVIESESYESSLRRLATAMDWFQRRLESKELEASPAILNLSLGFPGRLLASPQIRPALVAVRLLLAHLIDVYRVLVVAAVGNDGPSGAPLAPAFFPDVLSVGAISLDDAPAPFSCGGPGPSPYEMIDTPDVVGYGVDIMSAMQRDVPGVSWYRTASGTSMAAPYVSGIAALVASDTGLQGSDLADQLKHHAIPLSHPPARVGSGLARVPSS
jgi:serine protease AprX